MSDSTNEPPFPKSLEDEDAINVCALYLAERYAKFYTTSAAALKALGELTDGYADDARKNKDEPLRVKHYKIQQVICAKAFGMLATKGRTARQ